METMGILGFIFGMSALSFALVMKEQVAKIEKDLKKLTKQLIESGAIKKYTTPN